MITTRILPLGLLALAVGFTPASARAADPGERGGFVIHNPTGVTIRYQVKWGEKGEWKSHTLESGYKFEHTHGLNNGKAPPPYVRFDNTGGDGKVTNTVQHMKFGRRVTTVNGHTNKVLSDGMWHYEFKYAKDGRNLGLYKR